MTTTRSWYMSAARQGWRGDKRIQLSKGTEWVKPQRQTTVGWSTPAYWVLIVGLAVAYLVADAGEGDANYATAIGVVGLTGFVAPWVLVVRGVSRVRADLAEWRRAAEAE